jgi:hypothetical protein
MDYFMEMFFAPENISSFKTKSLAEGNLAWQTRLPGFLAAEEVKLIAQEKPVQARSPDSSPLRTWRRGTLVLIGSG